MSAFWFFTGLFCGVLAGLLIGMKLWAWLIDRTCERRLRGDDWRGV